MKRLSDYKGDAAFDLLADVFEPVTKILADIKVKEAYSKSKIDVAKYILKEHKAEATEIFRAIDAESDITPISILKMILDIITDVENDPSIAHFFKSAE